MLWVVADIFCDLVVVIWISDYVVMKMGLPYIFAVFSIAEPFEC